MSKTYMEQAEGIDHTQIQSYNLHQHCSSIPNLKLWTHDGQVMDDLGLTEA